MIDLRNRHQVQVAEILETQDLEWFAFDPEAPSPTADECEQVEVEDLLSPFTAYELEQLSYIDVLEESNKK